ncbi:MAG: hypothetical protein NTZ35_03095 [Ignavibacteriales bacterium]|nr:hypothetical protein [Ignavibacteriales bacterium]
MNILQAFSAGFRRAMSEWKMILLLYVANFLVALPLVMAFRSSLASGFGQSMDSSNLMQGLDFSVMLDFLNQHRDGIRAIMQQIYWVLLVYMLINTLLAGGVLTVVRNKKEKFSASAFFGGCGVYFLRFLRLFLIFGVLLVVVLSIAIGVLGGIGNSIADNASSELTEYWVRIVTLAVLSLLAMLIIMVADYAKIIVVAHDEHSMLKTAWRSAKLVSRYFFRTFGLQLLMVFVPIVLFVVYLWLDLSIGMTSGITILVMFILQQLFIVSKAWTKVFFFAGELSLYYSLQPFGSQAAVPTMDTSSLQTTAV